MSVSKFGRARGGNVAMMWALMGTVLVGLLGLTVDFTRGVMVRNELQSAADSAVLVAARQPANMTMADRTAQARAFFDAEAPQYATSARITLTDIGNNGYRLHATAPLPTSLAQLVTQRDWEVGVDSEAVRGGVNIEVALVLDTTGSMSGQRITDLRNSAGDLVDLIVQTNQTPYYSKMALVTWAMGVNAGPYATAARGAITPSRSISAAAWANGAARTVTALTKANPAVFTSAAHGFAVNDVVWLANISGSGAWATNLNGRWYTVASVPSANTFQLRDSGGAIVRTNSYSGSYPGGAKVTRCLEAACQVRVTSNGHDLANNDWVWIQGVNGMTQINSTTDTAWQVANVTTNAYALVGSVGPNYAAYTNGGSGSCTTPGCQYYRFTSAAGSTRILTVSTCVSERIGGNALTDASPLSSPVGFNYTGTGNPCDAATGIIPLTTNTTALHNRINSLVASGSTAGQIGAAWGWYAVSPNWGDLWGGAARPASYNTPETQKIVVLMTDGAFNSPYCNGVIARDALSGSGSTADHTNCNATNGSSASQTIAVCNAMKARNITVYTVGFHIDNDATAMSVFRQCATNDDHFYLADDRATLQEAFRNIGQSISQLRLTH